MEPILDRPLDYHLLQHRAYWDWWRPFLGTVLLTIAFLVVNAFVVAVVFVVGLAVAGRDISDGTKQMVDFDHVTPLSLAYLNVVIALLIPTTWLLMRVVHGLRPRWLASVTPRLRWRWLLVCAGLAFLALVATVVVNALVPGQDDSGQSGGTLNDWTTQTRNFVLVIAFLTPLQAAGEEYAFRGYLTQAFGGLFLERPRVARAAAVVVPAVLFALAHGGQELPVFVDRFAFGLVAGVLVVATGGLEAGIAMHVLNNFVAYGFALAYSSMSDALNPSGSTWWSLPATLTQSLVFAGLVLLAARRRGLQTSSSVMVLEGSVARV